MTTRPAPAPRNSAYDGDGIGRIEAPVLAPEASALERYRALGVTLLLMAIGAGVVLAIAFAHYQMHQAPHRLLKVLAGLGLAVALALRPAIALYSLPFAFAFVEWLPKSPLPGMNSLNLINSILVASWIGRTVVLRQPMFEHTPLNRPIAIFLCWAVLCWIYSTMLGSSLLDPLASFQYHVNYFVGLFLVFPLFYLVRTWIQIRRLVFWFVVASSFGVLTLVSESSGLGGGRRVGGAIGDINMAGAFFALVTILGLALVRAKWLGLLRRVLLAGATGAACLAMFLTGSRGAILALAVGAVPLAFRTGASGVLMTVVIVGGVSVAAPAFVVERIQETWDGLSGGGGYYDTGNEVSGGRLMIWRTTLEIVSENPILGVGLGRLPVVMREKIGRIKAGHNLYLEIMGEMGIPGFLLLMWIFVTSFIVARRLARQPGFAGVLGVAYLFAMGSVVVSNLFGQRFFHFSMAGSWAFLTALVCRAIQLSETSGAAEASDSGSTKVGAIAGR